MPGRHASCSKPPATPASGSRTPRRNPAAAPWPNGRIPKPFAEAPRRAGLVEPAQQRRPRPASRQGHLAGASPPRRTCRWPNAPPMRATPPRRRASSFGAKPRIILLLASRRVDQQEARGLHHHRRPQQSLDDAQAKVGPRHQPAGGDDIAVVDDHPVGLHPHVGKARPELLGEIPVRRRRPPGKQSCRRQRKGPAAVRRQHRALRMPVEQPARIGLDLAGLEQPVQAARRDQHRRRIACGFIGMAVVPARKAPAGLQPPMAGADRAPAMIDGKAPRNVEQGR